MSRAKSRRQIAYTDVLAKLAAKGISIRVVRRMDCGTVIPACCCSTFLVFLMLRWLVRTGKSKVSHGGGPRIIQRCHGSRQYLPCSRDFEQVRRLLFSLSAAPACRQLLGECRLTRLLVFYGHCQGV